MSAVITASLNNTATSVSVTKTVDGPVASAAPAAPPGNNAATVVNAAAKVLGPAAAAADKKESAAASGKMDGVKVSVEKPLTLAQIKAKLADEAAKTIQAIAQDNFDRKNGKVANPLAKGVSYRVEYYPALKQRLETLQKQAEMLKTKLDGLAKDAAAQQVREKIQSQISTTDKIRAAINLRLEHMVKEGVFLNGIAPTEFFSPVLKDGTPTGRLPEHYRLLPGKSPSEALNALQSGLTLMGCGETCQLAYYTAIQKVLGKEKFDAVLSNMAFPLAIGSGRDDDFDEANPINRLLRPCLLRNISEAKKGQMVHFENIGAYPVKHYLGSAVGYNLMVIKEGQDPVLAGLGVDPNGVTKNQVLEILRHEFNAKPIQLEEVCTQDVAKKIIDDTIRQADAKKAAMILQGHEVLKNVELSSADFTKQLNGKLVHHIAYDFDVEKIEKLASLSIKDACIQMEAWCKEKLSDYRMKQIDAQG